MVVKELFNLDTLWKHRPENTILVNDIDPYSTSNLSDYVANTYSTILETSATCECGRLAADYLVGVVCPDCGTVCVDSNDSTEPILWLGAIDGIPFVNPHFWLSMTRLLGNNDSMRYLCDAHYKKPVHKFVVQLLEKVLGGKRSYVKLIGSFEEVFDFLETNPEFMRRPNSKTGLEVMRYIYREHCETVFSNHLPLPQKSLFVMERRDKGVVGNLNVVDVIDIVKSWSGLAVKERKGKLERRYSERGYAVTISKICDIFSTYMATYFYPKKALIRYSMMGKRPNMVARGTITSIQDYCSYDEIRLPWTLSVELFKPILYNYMLNRDKLTMNAADELFNSSLVCWNETVAGYFRTMYSESGGGIDMLFLRNPSLYKESLQLVRATRTDGMYKYTGDVGNARAKRDSRRSTIGMSAVNTVAFNADFDGDQMALQPVIGHDNILGFEGLRPVHSTMSSTKPYELSRSAYPPPPTVDILSRYLQDDYVCYDPLLEVMAS